MKSGEGTVLACIRRKGAELIKREDARLFLTAFFIALLVHLFVFTNKLTNHDDVSCLYSDCSFGIILARWLLSTARSLMGPFSSSYLGGLLGSACLAGSAVLVLKMLKLRTKICKLLGLVILIAFPTLASTYAYMFVAPPFMLALLLSVVAARLILTKNTLKMLAAALLLSFSLGIYQAYFAMSCALVVLVLILELCEGKYKELKTLLKDCFLYLSVLAAGMLLYFVFLKLNIAAKGVSLIYKPGEDLLSELPVRIFQSYLYFGAFYFGHWAWQFPKWFVVCSMLCIAADMWLVIAAVRRQELYKKPLLLISLAVLIILFPLACNLAIVMASFGSTHHLMVYPLVLPFVLPLCLLERLAYPEEKARQRIVTAALSALLLTECLCGYMCIVTTNKAYFTLDMLNRNAEAFYNRIITRVEMLEGFTPETRIAMVGHYVPDEKIPYTNYTGIGDLESFINMYTKDDYCKLFLGAQYDYLSDDEKLDLSKTETLKNMPVYPADGSVIMADGMAIVKLGESN